MSLPASWVESLFARLTIRYGAGFMRQYADLDPAAVKADWASVLAGFAGHPESIRYALDNLPADKPPNAMQFRAICNGGPREDAPSLPAPKADAAIVAPLLERMKTVAASMTGPAYCAERLREIAKTRPLTQAQKQALAECERFDPVGAQIGTFTPISEDALPPGMRA